MVCKDLIDVIRKHYGSDPSPMDCNESFAIDLNQARVSPGTKTVLYRSSTVL